MQLTSLPHSLARACADTPAASISFLRAAFLGPAFAAVVASGQVAPAPSASAPGATGGQSAAVVLSPFEVSAGGD